MGIGFGQGVSSGSTGYWHPDPIARLNMGYDVVGAGNRMFNNRNQEPTLSPMASALIQRAMASQANAPTLQSLFPGMTMPSQFTTPMANLSGQFGAGRFLGQNAGQFGNPSAAMMGFAPNTNNTTT